MLLALPEENNSNDVKTNHGSNVCNIVTIVDTVIDQTQEQPSVRDLNEKEGWITAVRREICGVNFQVVTNDILSQADALVRHLFSRMKCHLKERFPNETYGSHWCFVWAIRQFTRVSLMCCLAGHIKKDLQSKRSVDSLLTVCWSNFHVVEKESTLLGAYTIFDPNNGAIVRSGKACPVTNNW